MSPECLHKISSAIELLTNTRVHMEYEQYMVNSANNGIKFKRKLKTSVKHGSINEETFPLNSDIFIARN